MCEISHVLMLRSRLIIQDNEKLYKVVLLESVKTTSIKWEYWSTMSKIKHYQRHENKVNENKVLYWKALRYETIKKNKVVSLMLNLQAYYHFKLDLQKVDQYTGGKWLIHGTKRHKDNQLQRLELPSL